MKVPLLDLGVQLKGLREQMLSAVTEVIDSTSYILGPKVAELEEQIAAYCGSPHGIGVASGTDALLASLMALGVGPGDLVVTTPYTFFATVGSILRLGARPLFVDIEPASFNMNPVLLEDTLAESPERTARVKVILPVHLYGQCADMSRIMEIAGRYDLPVLEDAAQAIGASCPIAVDGEISWQRAGSIGVAGCFSFFPSKNLGGIGDGGMVVCRDRKLAEKIGIIRGHGSAPKYHHSLVGGNFRLDPIQAAVLSVKLPHLDTWHQARRENAGLYNRLLSERGLVGELVSPPVEIYREAARAIQDVPDYHIYNQYVIRVKNRDSLLAALKGAGIGVEIYYPIPLHQQECMEGMGFSAGMFPEAERAAAETLALPIYPELTYDMQRYVVEQIADFYDNQAGRSG